LTGSPRAAALAVANAMPDARATAVHVRPRICTARVNSGPNRNRVLTGSRAPLAEVHDDGWTQRRPSSGRCPEPLDRWPRLQRRCHHHSNDDGQTLTYCLQFARRSIVCKSGRYLTPRVQEMLDGVRRVRLMLDKVGLPQFVIWLAWSRFRSESSSSATEARPLRITGGRRPTGSGWQGGRHPFPTR